MKLQRTKIIKVILLLVFPIFSGNVYAEKIMPPVFEWNTRYLDASANLDLNYNNSPFAGHDVPADSSIVTNTYNPLFNENYIMSLTLVNDTAPVYGEKSSDALAIVKSYIQRLDYVFADFEVAVDPVTKVIIYNYSQVVEDVNEMVRQVRTDPNANVNQAYIGNYGWHAGKNAYYDLPGLFSRTDPATSRPRSNMVQDYLDSDVNVSMPICYFYHFYWVHTLADGLNWAQQFGSDNISPTIPAALFWAPLERYSSAKRALPQGHKIIPWVGPWVANAPFPNDAVPEPDRADNQALLKHFRLRGADGYYALFENVSNPAYYLNRTEFSDDMNVTWRSLDDFMFPSSVTSVLNTDTDKTGGIEWSGTRHLNDIKILITNKSGIEQDIDYPDIFNLPDRSPVIQASNTHSSYDYVITNLLDNGEFNAGITGWYLTAGTWVATGGVDGTGGIMLQGGQYAALETQGADVEPGALMVLEMQAKGVSGAQLKSNYYFYDVNNNIINDTSGSGLNYANTGLNVVPDNSYKTYRQTFTVPNVPGIKKIRPVFYNSFGVTDPDDILWLDNVTIKFEDPNLVKNGDFNTDASGWYFSNGNWEPSGCVSDTACMKLQGGVYSVHAAGLKVKTKTGQVLSLDLDARGIGNAGLKVNYYYYDAEGNNLGFASAGMDEKLNSVFHTYRSTFTVGAPATGIVDYIVPILYNTFGDEDPVNNIVWVDNISIIPAVN